MIGSTDIEDRNQPVVYHECGALSFGNRTHFGNRLKVPHGVCRFWIDSKRTSANYRTALDCRDHPALRLGVRNRGMASPVALIRDDRNGHQVAACSLASVVKD